MSWVRIDDTFWSHPKVLEVGNRAAGALVRAIAWSAQHRKDGWVSPAACRLIEPATAVWRALSDVRLLDEYGPSGARVHDFQVYNGSPAAREERSAVNRENGRKGAEARWNRPTEPPAPDGESPSKPMAPIDGGEMARARIPSRPVPSRPVPPEIDPPSEDPAPQGLKTTDTDPWELAPAGEDPDALPAPATAKGKAKAPKEDLPHWALSTGEAAVLAAITADPSLAPIVQRPAQKAKDLVAVAPGVDVVREVRKAGQWLRDNPSRAKKNGNAFLGTWVARAQEHVPAGARYTPPAHRGPPPPVPPESPEKQALIREHVSRMPPPRDCPPSLEELQAARERHRAEALANAKVAQ